MQESNFIQENIELEFQKNLEKEIELEAKKTDEKSIGISTPPPRRESFYIRGLQRL